tara:strand:+ start:41 stop:1216 length:1176 start_codon:yes stop_codon:yes gene_type:complete
MAREYILPFAGDSIELPGSFSDLVGPNATRAQEFDYVIAGAGGDPMHAAIAEIYASTQAGGQGDQQRAMLIEELSRKSGRPVTQETINYVLAQMDKGRFQSETGGSEFDNTVTSQEKADIAAAQASGAETEEEINAWLRKKETPTRITTTDDMQIITTDPKPYVPGKKITPSDRQPGIEEANNREVPEEVEEKVTFKDRLADLWADGNKRNAILSSISETLLETRSGVDAYGNRFRDLPKNVNARMQEAEALDMVKTQATLDMMKTQAETAAAMDPRQFLSNAEKIATAYANSEAAQNGYAPGSEQWFATYSQAIENHAFENLITAPVEAITAINQYIMSGVVDEKTKASLQKVVDQLVNKISGNNSMNSRSDKSFIDGVPKGNDGTDTVN